MQPNDYFTGSMRDTKPSYIVAFLTCDVEGQGRGFDPRHPRS